MAKTIGLFLALAFLAAAVVPTAWAQAPADYPARPVRVVVPFAPGGLVDVTARIVGQKMSDQLGKPFVVDNRTGAGGTIGTGIVARATGDGYTLLVVENSLAVLPSLYSRLPFDVIRDLTGVTQLLSAPMVLVIHPSLGAQSFAEFVTVVRAHPGKFNYGSGGRGSSPHLGSEMLKAALNLDLAHVPYKGGAEALSALLGGQTQMQFVTPALGVSHVRSGKLRAVLAATQGKRSPVLPDVITAREAGLTDYAVENWFGILAPASTPKPIVATLHAEAIKALNAPELRERFVAQGSDVVGSTPEQFTQFIRAEARRWSGAVKAAGIQPE